MVTSPTSGTSDAWESLVMVKVCSKAAIAVFADMTICDHKKSCLHFREDGLAIEAGENDTLIVNKLVADPEMFGLFGFSYLVGNKDKIQATGVNGIKPSLERIQNYSYPIARPLFYYVKKAHIGVVPGIKEFLKEFTSTKAMGNRGYLTDIGLVPLSEDKYKVTRDSATKLILIKL